MNAFWASENREVFIALLLPAGESPRKTLAKKPISQAQSIARRRGCFRAALSGTKNGECDHRQDKRNEERGAHPRSRGN